jgi:hypothetical protein
MTHVVTVDRQLHDRDEFLAEIKDRLLQSHALMKWAHDKKRSDMEFTIGNWVWLRLNQWVATSVRTTGPSKLGAKFFAPYQVTVKIGLVSYRLQLSPHAKIHNVFHIVFLKKFEGSPPMTTPLLPPIVHGYAVPDPEKVVRAQPMASSWEVLIQWQGKTAAEATWEPLEQFKEAYPEFKLENELFRQGGGSVMDSFFHKQYTRRRKPIKDQEPISG